MGKVFTTEEIKNKKMPSIENFNKAIKFVRKIILESKVIEGGLIYGSMASKSDSAGSYNCRSDFDLLILCNSDNKLAKEKELRSVFDFFRKYNIPIDLVIVDNKFSKTDVHQIKPILAPHLFWCAREFGFIKQNPLEFIQFKCNPIEDLKNYVKHKMRLESQLYKMDFMDEIELCRFLQKVLEAPFHIARNFINCCGKGVESHDKSLRDIISLYRKVSNMTDVSALIECMKVNEWYINSLYSDHVCERHYTDILMNGLKPYAFKSIDFIKLNAQLVDNY